MEEAPLVGAAESHGEADGRIFCRTKKYPHFSLYIVVLYSK